MLRIGSGRAPVGGIDRVETAPPTLAMLSPRDVGPAPSGSWIFLGLDPDGVAHVAVEAEPEDDWVGLRQAGALLDDLGAGELTMAVALLGWHASHTHCPRCGTPTVVEQAGWSRRCPADDTEHYPRTDPAVIMTVVDDDDRVLLGHNKLWPDGRFSTLAGFVEPGEPLEAAVRREVVEEVGIRIGEVEYLGSQPWPFPASLMLGFTARALTTDITVDGAEISEARWFTREQLVAGIGRGQVLPPSGISIARRLLEHWYGGPIDDGPLSWR